jgi:hypothetical protein
MPILIENFEGIAPKIPARFLRGGQAQVARNCEAIGTSLKPLKGLGASIAAALRTGTQTLYKYGQNETRDGLYWFSFADDADVVRSQIAGDDDEWTFITGGGYDRPQATHFALATAGSGPYPTATRPLGLPSPTNKAVLTDLTFTPGTRPAELYISPAQIALFTSRFGVQVSLDNEATYVARGLTDPITRDTIAAAVNSIPGVSAVVAGGGVEVKTVATGRDVTLYLKYADDTYAALGAAGGAAGQAMVRLNPGDLEQMRQWAAGGTSNNYLRIDVWINGAVVHRAERRADATFSPAIVAQIIDAGPQVNAYVDGGDVVVRSDATGSGINLFLNVFQADTGYAFTKTANGTDNTAAVLTLRPENTIYFTVEDDFEVSVNGGAYQKVEIPGTTPAAIAGAINGISGLTAQVSGTNGVNVTVTTTAIGPSASVVVRYRTTRANVLFASGRTLDPGPLESRVYTWTWVDKVLSYEVESAPAPPSDVLDVYVEQGVSLSLPDLAPPSPYAATAKRIYRAVNGVYLFVAEIPAATTVYEDTQLADALSEELPTTDWDPPPDGLHGIINLPNGIVAGFVGRDLYFCEPYRPHAWPQSYVQTLDYPIVGLGRLDTTLVALTTGTPYLVQGSHPDSMVVVKTDLEQACASKRSIVSMAGQVVYSSPDGLVAISPSGSKVITENLFDRDQWQGLMSPTLIHGYEHDLQYHGFFGANGGGFVLDFKVGSLTLHTVSSAAGFSDLITDKLFVVSDSLRIWGIGANQSYTWRSKMFTHPQIVGHAAAQIEAEAYPVTCQFFLDGAAIHTQTVQNRAPFRLPARQGRDWEVELTGTSEVFKVAVHGSMQDIASV